MTRWSDPLLSCETGLWHESLMQSGYVTKHSIGGCNVLVLLTPSWSIVACSNPPAIQLHSRTVYNSVSSFLRIAAVRFLRNTMIEVQFAPIAFP